MSLKSVTRKRGKASADGQDNLALLVTHVNADYWLARYNIRGTSPAYRCHLAFFLRRFLLMFHDRSEIKYTLDVLVKLSLGVGAVSAGGLVAEECWSIYPMAWSLSISCMRRKSEDSHIFRIAHIIAFLVDYKNGPRGWLLAVSTRK